MATRKRAVVKTTAELTENLSPVIDDYKGVERIMGGSRDVMVDTFKLEPAVMQKNVSWTVKETLVPIEHCHIYHTYDSSGKKLNESNAVGGHKHQLKILVEDGKFIVECSPPIQNNKSETISKVDNHTHRVIYLKSEKLVMRKVNMDAAQIASSFFTPAAVPTPSNEL